MPQGFYNKNGKKFIPPNRKGAKFTREQKQKLSKLIREAYSLGERRAY